MRTRARVRLSVGAVAAIAIAATLGAQATAAVSLSKPTHVAKTLEIGGYNLSVLDPHAVGYAAGGDGTPLLAFGTLFDNGPKAGVYLPDLAASYSFNRAGTEITVTLRKGLKFSDGSPLDASALEWNLTADEAPTAFAFQYMGLVKSVSTSGKYTVKVTFTQPDTTFIADIVEEVVGNPESPTAYNSEGATTFALDPVGAGPFKISSFIPTQSVSLVKNPLYWNAKQVYLQAIDYTNTGSDSTVQYDDLESGAISVLSYSAASSSPTTVVQAIQNPSFNVHVSPNTSITIAAVNTYAPPFNNLMAREAIDYCVNRQVIASSTMAGFVDPGWIFAGPAADYYPTGSDGKPSLAVASTYQAYPYNPTMGTAIVQQLGGLKFTLITFMPQLVIIATAMQEQMSQCGIQMSISNVAGSSVNPDLQTGTYQMILTGTGGLVPQLATAFINPSATLDAYGFNDPQIVQWLDESFATTSTAKQITIWHDIWKRLDSDAVAIPIITGGTYYLFDKCLKGVTFYGGPVDYVHSYFTCGS